MQIHLEGFLSETELAQEFGLNKATLVRWRKKQIGPPFIPFGKTILYRRESVLDWLKSKEVTPPGKPSGRATGHTQRLARPVDRLSFSRK